MTLFYYESLHPEELLELPKDIVEDSLIKQELKDWYFENKEK